MRTLSFEIAFIFILLVTPIVYAGNDPNCEYPNVLLLVDKSGSMDEQIAGGRKWDIAHNAIKSILNSFSNNIRFGLALFPWTSGCQTGQVLVPISDNNSSQILNTLSQNGPDGSTPLASSLKAMNSYSGIHDPNRRNFVLLVTDGMDTCSYDPTGEPVQAVQQLHNAGVGVFVVGFGSGVDPNTLNNMAVAGGYPRNGNPKYYQCDNAQELNQTLNDIIKIVSQEICDGKDNDCNGEIDDKIAPEPCSGLCNKSGMRVCGNGQWGPCRDYQGNEIPPIGDEGKPCDTKREGVCKDGVWKCDVNGNLLCDQLVQPSQNEKDPCEGITCKSGEFCRDGICVKSCGFVNCNEGYYCDDYGNCVLDICYGIKCKVNEYCSEGRCMVDKCYMGGCPYNRICDQSTGNCVDDPCTGIVCPDTLKCYRGQCIRPEDIPVVIYDPDIGVDAQTDGGVDNGLTDSSGTKDYQYREEDYGNLPEDIGSLEGSYNPSDFDKSTSGCSCSHLF